MQEKYGGRGRGPMEVRVWLRMLSCTMTVEKELRRMFTEEFGTTLPRFDVMASLERHPDGQTMGQLSKALLVSNGNVTAVVRQLSDKGLVSTRPAENDRRTTIVALTEEGRKRFATLAKAHHDWIGSVFSGFAPERQEELFHLLADLKSSIGERLEK
ncbi:MarR family transcriptional regulator [Pacificimonas flava]|uniref:MarR family transcriptional regulator n=2 Tax=Pacificimonas TaxID=1960290 RepID=A0A219B627_9SPHN|nr:MULTISPECIES: MarR family transcriptional regulator [Pacificimonas]MBZ6379173.1 MarR family transcriptional regulator [Pacificimonas aurantium]OWV33603.1 MarR family transcriptional regulator [Pacificimonas flava]